jgi:hypothetical protein
VVTIFSIPKPFSGHIKIIQQNAIRSWTLLRPRPEILLFGNDEGVVDAARRLDVRHIPDVARNEYGTPLLNDVFEKARHLATHDLLCYVNADIILMNDLLDAVEHVAACKRQFLVVGQRWNMDIPEALDFCTDWESGLRAKMAAQGRLEADDGIDYFVFPRRIGWQIPPFAIGRTVWDNWLIYRARVLGLSVIDATEAVTAVHQVHDYSHVLPVAKAADVWKGPEATRNLQLAGGREHIFTLQDATYSLSPGGLRRTLGRRNLSRALETLPTLSPYLALPAWVVRKLISALRRIGKGIRRTWNSKEAGADVKP